MAFATFTWRASSSTNSFERNGERIRMAMISTAKISHSLFVFIGFF